MMDFSKDTYIVLDLPDEVARQVLEMRKRLGFFFESIPAEITITGSSGIGVVSPEQDAKGFIDTVEKIAAVTEPIETRFKGVSRFPNSGVFFLEPIEQTPFKALHRQFAESGLKFHDCPFPYFAHCTIKNFHGQPVEDPEAILSQEGWTKEPFVLDDLRVYSLVGTDCRRLYETKLRGKA